jgi:hypothetical protein
MFFTSTNFTLDILNYEGESIFIRTVCFVFRKTRAVDQTGESKGLKSGLYRGWMIQYLKVQFSKVLNRVGSVCIINGCGLASVSFPMLNACATIFETLAPLTDNPL